MDLNRIALFLDDEKINYFLMLCSAKHFINLGSLVGVSLFLWRGGGGGGSTPFATQSAVLDYQHWHPLGSC